MKLVFDFIDNNKKLLDKKWNYSNEFYIEVFDNGGQLNFEIFSRELFKKRLDNMNIAIPISY